MTQPTTAWIFSDYYNAIGERVFNDSAPTGDILATSKRFINEGYQIFLASNFWTFMYPTASLNIVSGVTETNLPDNFAAIRGIVSRSAASYYPPLQEVASDEIRRRRAQNDVEGIPSLYAISAKTFDEEDGQQWEILTYPKPNSNITLAFQYRVAAALLDGASDYPLGGALHSMTILQFAYAQWEQEKTDEASIEYNRARGPNNPQSMLRLSMTIDNDFRSNIIQAGETRQLYKQQVTLDGDTR